MAYLCNFVQYLADIFEIGELPSLTDVPVDDILPG